MLMNHRIGFLSLALILFSLSYSLAQEESLLIDIPPGPKPWTSLSFNNDPDRFQFAIVSDRTGSMRPGVFETGVRKLNLLQPEFVMSVGDLIEGYTEDTIELRRQWEEFDAIVAQLEMPFFYVPGNHDITNAVMEAVWKQRYGPTYYHFVYHDVLFLCLNSEDQRRGAGRGSISDEQLAWIEKTLAQHPQARWTLLFMHQPLWLQEVDPVRWSEVEALLRDRRHTVFVGHRHHYGQYERNNGTYIMLATTGGGSALRGPQLGEFDHVVWVTMTDEGPIIANLLLDGILGEDIVTGETRDFIYQMGRRRPLRVEPYFSDTELFEQGTAHIRLTNDEDVPMRVRLDNKFSWDLKSELSRGEIEVAPNTVAFVELELRARREVPLEELTPVRLIGTFMYSGDRHPDIEYPFEAFVGPERKYLLRQVEKPVNIDGDLREWDELPHAIETLDAADCAARFDARHDDQYLYIAARVFDDEVKVDPAEVAFNQDFVTVIIDGAPLAESANRTGEGWYQESVIYTITPAAGDTPSSTFYDDRLPPDVRWATKTLADGYAVEFALPLAYLQERQGNDWRTARINIVVQDWDSGRAEKPRYFWQPDWRGRDNRVGSGMFFREELK
jgi:hypothetical protein